MQDYLKTEVFAEATARATAYAKLNLHLAVKGRRQDGFHNLESIFLTLDFGDALQIEAGGAAGGLEIVMEGGMAALIAGLPTDENIIFKAVASFRRETGWDQGLRIRVNKMIPPGGGLGGGSSDAAAALLAMNALAARAGCPPLSPAQLLRIGAALGSDVPFFLSGAAAAWVSGRGEVIEPVRPPAGLFFVLAGAGFPSPTAGAFRLLSEARRGGSPLSGGGPAGGRRLIKALYESPVDWPFWNDFLPVFLREGAASPENCPPDSPAGLGRGYAGILGRLKSLGAGFAGLSGSGSTCFGVFTEKATAENARDALGGELGGAGFAVLAQPAKARPAS